MTTKYDIWDFFCLPYKITQIRIDTDGVTYSARPDNNTVEYSDTLMFYLENQDEGFKVGSRVPTKATIVSAIIENNKKVYYKYQSEFAHAITDGCIREEYITYYINKEKEDVSNAET